MFIEEARLVLSQLRQTFGANIRLLITVPTSPFILAHFSVYSEDDAVQ